jgi:hypothetical protein
LYVIKDIITHWMRVDLRPGLEKAEVDFAGADVPRQASFGAWCGMPVTRRRGSLPLPADRHNAV